MSGLLGGLGQYGEDRPREGPTPAWDKQQCTHTAAVQSQRPAQRLLQRSALCTKALEPDTFSFRRKN